MILLYLVTKTVKFIDTEKRMMVARGMREGEMVNFLKKTHMFINKYVSIDL